MALTSATPRYKDLFLCLDCLPTWRFFMQCPHSCSVGHYLFSLKMRKLGDIIAINCIIIQHKDPAIHSVFWEVTECGNWKAVTAPGWKRQPSQEASLRWCWQHLGNTGFTRGPWKEERALPVEYFVLPVVRGDAQIILEWTHLRCLDWIKTAQAAANRPQGLGNSITSFSLLSWRNKDNSTFPRLGLGTS